MREAFLSGYKKKAKIDLPENWRKLASFIDLNSLLELLSVPQERLELSAQVIASIEETMAND